jgi:predicted transcriptional regulator
VAFYKVCEQRIEVPERVFEQPTEVPEPSIYRNSDKVMDAIRYGGPVTAAEIVEMTGVGLSSVSTTLTKLWKEGRIDRIRVNGRYEHQLSADEDTEPQQEACVIEPIETNDSQNKPLPFNPPDSAKLELEVGGDPMLLPISAWRQLYGELCRMFG